MSRSRPRAHDSASCVWVGNALAPCDRERAWTPTPLPRIAHDQEAFEAFYRVHVEAVQRFVARRVSDPHRAADLTAEVFLAAIESADSYRPDRGSSVAWLFGVVRVAVSAEHGTPCRLRDVADPVRRPCRPPDAQRRRVRRVLSALPPCGVSWTVTACLPLLAIAAWPRLVGLTATTARLPAATR